MRNRKAIGETIVGGLVFLFLYTGLTKYVDHQQFVHALDKSPLLKQVSYWVSFTLPGIEIITAVLLIVPRTRIKTLFFSLLLLLIFTGYLGYILLFAAQLPCTCGGVISKMSWPQHLVFNIIMIVLNVLAISLLRPKSQSAHGRPGVPKTYGDPNPSR